MVAKRLAVPVAFFLQDVVSQNSNGYAVSEELSHLLAMPESIAPNRAFLAVAAARLRKAIIALDDPQSEGAAAACDSGIRLRGSE
jgi:hypothetical protein